MDPYLAEIKMFAGNFAPRGYALCQGQLLAISQNDALFALIGTTYGGDGMETFSLPDLRGRRPIGTGQGSGLSNVVLGQVFGSEQITLTTAHLPAHTHASIICSNAPATSTTPEGNFMATTAENPEYNTSSNSSIPNSSTSPSGGGSPISLISPFLGINFIIATEGIFPSRN